MTARPGQPAPLLALLLALACSPSIDPATSAGGVRGGAPGRAGAAPLEPAAHEPGRVPPPGAYAPGFDVQHYHIELALPDTGSYIRARTTIDVARGAGAADTLRLDLTGLRVTAVQVAYDTMAAAPAAFRQADGRIFIPLAQPARMLRVAVDYEGTPDNGLIIRRNVHGEPGAFADNWPDRARFWFPSIDHPSDKATVEFEVKAPAGWSVVGNGTGGQAGGGWRWRMSQPIPTYLMVVGGARFERGEIGCASAGRERCVPIEWWAFPEDRTAAQRIFSRAAGMLEFYARLVAPFPYERLAHVQSATMFGGMENATAIFYSERAIANGRLSENTVAHETAHQWFGDAVTPARWSDVWLSEGFATYFGMLFFEAHEGAQQFREQVSASWRSYLASGDSRYPVVDTLSVPDGNLMSLLNANSYQKGGAVLHMLRGVLGDSTFFRGVRRYYRAHEHGTATTADFQAALEAESKQELDWFFDQWLYRPGHPILEVQASYDARGREAVVRIAQVQPPEWPAFRMPLDVEVTVGSDVVRRRIELRGRETVLRLPGSRAPSRVRLDPDGWVLLERR